MPFPDSFSTSRLHAERLRSDHLPEVRRMLRDPEVMAHLGGVRNEDQTTAYLARNLQHWLSYGFGLWILRQVGGEDPIGRAVLRHLDVEGVDEVEVGYAFYPAFWHRGLASEVTATCLSFAWQRLHLASIVAVTTPGNLASQHVLRKAGLVHDREFTHEGTPSVLFRMLRPMTEGPTYPKP